jgi:hypothetical protein
LPFLQKGHNSPVLSDMVCYFRRELFIDIGDRV